MNVMTRRIPPFVLFLLVSGPIGAEPPNPAPRRYELLIDGENFVVELDQFATLPSKTREGTKYQVALRVAEYQPWSLNTVKFEYHRGFRVEDDGRETVRTAKLVHDLGFEMHITDLGGPLEKEAEPKALKLVVDLATESLREQNVKDLKTTKPASLKLGAMNGQRVGIEYSREGVNRRSLAYLLTSEQRSASIVVDYAASDQEDVLPLIEPTLASVKSF